MHKVVDERTGNAAARQAKSVDLKWLQSGSRCNAEVRYEEELDVKERRGCKVALVLCESKPKCCL